MTVKPCNILFAPGWYDNRIHRGIARYAREHHWHLIADMVRVGRIPWGWQGDGIITSLSYSREELQQFVQQANAPIVDLTLSNIRSSNIYHVACDHLAIGRMAAQYFLAQGFRNFLWVAYSPGTQQNLRVEGFREALQEAGKACQSLLLNEIAQDRRDTQLAALLPILRQAPKPLAILAHNDYIAASIIDSCLSTGIHIPDEVAVMGIENNDLVAETLSVPLTSIDVNFETLGYQAAACLDDVIHKKRTPQSPILISPKEVVVRKSTDVIAVNNPYVINAIKFIRAHFATNIGVADVADSCGISRRQLEQLFKHHLGRTINEELIRTRLNQVKELLLHSDLGINRIALEAGFTRSNYLHQLFRKRFGITPKQFRNRNRE